MGQDTLVQERITFAVLVWCFEIGSHVTQADLKRVAEGISELLVLLPFQVWGLQVCTTTPKLFCAGNQTQAAMHPRNAFYQLLHPDF